MLLFIKKYVRSLPRSLRWLLIFVSFIFLFGLIGYMFILFGGRLVVDEEEMILDARSTIESTDGEVIYELYDEYRIPVDYKQIPQHVKDAFIAIEDRRFYEHAGVDFKSVIRAIYRDLVAFRKVEGASTMTQQLAKNLFLSDDKTWMRKTKEVMAAIYLERNFSKHKLLELYLNAVYFGHGVYGVEAAAQKFFSKSISDVTVAEGALLAGLVQSPNKYSPIHNRDQALKRRNNVLQAMENGGVISTKQRLEEEGKTLSLNVKAKHIDPSLLSYIDLVTKEAASTYNLSSTELRRGGYRIVVHMNETMQKIAYELFQDDGYFPGNTKGTEGAFVMLEHHTGKIITALGGRQYEIGDLNRVTVNRQPGSTFKPLAVYAPAMMQEDYHPYTLIRDEKRDYDGYTAKNIDDVYEGEVSIYEAIVTSKNAPAVWLLNEIGISYAKEYLEKMNLHITDDGLAIALGGLTEGISPLALASSYQSFANEGKMIEPYTIERIYNQDDELIGEREGKITNVFNAQVAWDMTKILMDTVEEGTAEPGEYDKILAGKTGSTEHPFVSGKYKDAWFVGYTPEYVSALWMGYDSSDKNHYLNAGSKYPTKLMKAILTEYDKRISLEADFQQPEHVEDLPSPISLPTITNVKASYTFGGLKLVKGKLTWKGSNDERIVYHIYERKEGNDKKIGEVTGDTHFYVNDISLLTTNYFYIIPYDPLTGREGEPSSIVELSWQ